MSRSLVACLALSILSAIGASSACLASGGGVAAAIGLYVVTGSATTLLSASLVAALRGLAPAQPQPVRAEARVYA
ncbi:hypothetical protein [Amaricoccus sp.]|uniref:hypothetical protein n=1 Tax=Amaricoccus sp. TaxID=1872485 RepID=UPI001B6788B6|nr:hypothetical protein [Amaricoccus sp.]MBP7003308.1 hypothetical protein [Amaricoccus sp.]